MTFAVALAAMLSPYEVVGFKLWSDEGVVFKLSLRIRSNKDVLKVNCHWYQQILHVHAGWPTHAFVRIVEKPHCGAPAFVRIVERRFVA